MTGPDLVGGREAETRDLDRREVGVLAPLFVGLVLFGFYPMPLLNVIDPYVQDTLHHVGVTDPLRRVQAAPAREDSSDRARDDRHVRQAAPRLRSLWPILVVFGAACIGVLIEAFLPRERRYVAQFACRCSRSSPPWSASASSPTTCRGSAAARRRGLLVSEGTIALDGPTMFLWGLVLVFGLGGVLLFGRAAGRGRRLRVRRPGGRAAGHRVGAPVGGARPHRGLPAAAVRHRRDDALPGRG